MFATEVATLVMMVLGTILSTICVKLPYWKINDPEDAIRDNIVRYEGLWMKCQIYATGNWDCDDFNRFFLGVPSELQAARDFSIASIVLSGVSIVILFVGIGVGMQSFTCISIKNKVKKIMLCVAGFLCCLAGIFLEVAVSGYAVNVKMENDIYSSQLFQKYIWGKSLIFGWTGGVLFILAGFLSLYSGYNVGWHNELPGSHHTQVESNERNNYPLK